MSSLKKKILSLKFGGLRGALLIAYLVISGPVLASTVLVTPATLASAFSVARDGDVLQLVGTFANTRLYNRAFSSILTIDASRARFTDTLQLVNVSGVRIIGGRFDLAHDGPWTKGLLVSGGSNIYLNNITVVGSGTQMGVAFVGTTNAQITNGRFDGLNAAILFDSVDNGETSSNKITGATSDGIDISNSHDITARYNSCAGGKPVAGAHPDCIQLWSTAGNPLQSDIIVSANTADGSTQGFTSFAGGGGLRLQFVNNVVRTSDPQGIACYDCIDSIIADNRVSTLPLSKWKTSINVVGGSDNTIIGNVIAPYHAPRMDDFASSVAEPESWTMLIIGFAMTGIALRWTPVRRLRHRSRNGHLRDDVVPHTPTSSMPFCPPHEWFRSTFLFWHRTEDEASRRDSNLGLHVLAVSVALQ